MNYSEYFAVDVETLIEEFGQKCTFLLQQAPTSEPFDGSTSVTVTEVANVTAVFTGLSRSYRGQDVEASDRGILVMASDLPREPQKGDQVRDAAGVVWQVISHDVKQVNGVNIRYRLQVRR